MQGKRKELRKWERRDVITSTAYSEHSNTEAPKTPDAEATPQALGVRMRGSKPSDYPSIKERSAYDRINVVEVRETSEPQESRRRERIQAEVKQKESP